MLARLRSWLTEKPGRSVDDDDLDEWDRHHNDPRSIRGRALFERALGVPLSSEELTAMWREANSLVGQRAPADYGEFLAYGYLEGRRDALTLKGTPLRIALSPATRRGLVGRIEALDDRAQALGVLVSTFKLSLTGPVWNVIVRSSRDLSRFVQLRGEGPLEHRGKPRKIGTADA